MKDKIAFVCQRYGLEVNGGAEAECRMYAERLTDDYDVEVLTTCALDYTDWANSYPAGISEINGVTVRRFPVERPREQKQFDAISQEVIRDNHSDEAEERWMDAQGPYSPALVDFLARHGMDYHAVLFMTYLYFTTVRGIAQKCWKKILIPTAHDEWPIYQRQFRRVFQNADMLIYNSGGEKRFVEKLFPSARSKPHVIAGAGVVPQDKPLPDVRERYGFRGTYICYCGRIDESKGCGLLFDYFGRYKKKRPGDVKLVLTGKAAMEIPRGDSVISLGFVSEEEKLAIMKNAAAFVIASEYESLSIVVLESMMMGRPVLVNGKCEVLKDHCLMSNAGLYFYDYREFEGELDYLLSHKREALAMGENGKRYVRENYQWDTIIEKIHGLISE
ncbi:MAG: glycosyltransferase family 4 protein [Acidaminococcaceae bacterium]|nr:glycosyltransferase family 4 protein [Acidaminococcaceae bacterium]